MRKLMILMAAISAMAVMAVSASAASAATEWTDNGTVVKNGVDLTEAFEGTLQFAIPNVGTFGCETTVKATVKGPLTAEITEYNTTTSTCKGTGAFASCTVTADISNTPWTITNGATTLAVTKTGGNIKVTNTYGGTGCPLIGAPPREFASLTITPAGTNPITSLSISGISTEGNKAVISGSVTPESTKTLGLK
jgi:hypothetical protein